MALHVPNEWRRIVGCHNARWLQLRLYPCSCGNTGNATSRKSQSPSFDAADSRTNHHFCLISSPAISPRITQALDHLREHSSQNAIEDANAISNTYPLLSNVTLGPIICRENRHNGDRADGDGK
jgi:hypothetical protein